MNCPKCGVELKEEEKICPFCQATSNVVGDEVNTKYQEYKETESLNQKYGFNKLLIFSIVELVCCSQLFGLVSVILLFIKLKNAISERNFEEADKWERNIRLILIIGLVVGIFANIFNIIINLVPAVLETYMLMI